jgi:hypothetical protein
VHVDEEVAGFLHGIDGEDVDGAGVVEGEVRRFGIRVDGIFGGGGMEGGEYGRGKKGQMAHGGHEFHSRCVGECRYAGNAEKMSREIGDEMLENRNVNFTRPSKRLLMYQRLNQTFHWALHTGVTFAACDTFPSLPPGLARGRHDGTVDTHTHTHVTWRQLWQLQRTRV